MSTDRPTDQPANLAARFFHLLSSRSFFTLVLVCSVSRGCVFFIHSLFKKPQPGSANSISVNPRRTAAVSNTVFLGSPGCTGMSDEEGKKFCFLFTFAILFKYLFPTSNLKGEYLLKRENIGKGKGHVCLLDAVKPLLTLVVSFFLFFSLSGFICTLPRVRCSGVASG